MVSSISHAQGCLRILGDLTTVEFSRGGDKPVREMLARVVAEGRDALGCVNCGPEGDSGTCPTCYEATGHGCPHGPSVRTRASARAV